jgi:DNA repair exonuclease SbcCD ATPase subunit
MIISEIGIKGYKSFGNNEQVLKLDTGKGKLILLVGNNGNGKSSLIESFEYALYGKVKSSKVKKWAKLSTLPNRINGELLTRIKFESHSTQVEVRRGISPSKLDLIENGVENKRAGKVNLNDTIEKYVGMDIETFKSFISMSINDFKNFISLSNDEKAILLDKLFNLEVINIMNTILKELVRNNKTRMASLDAEIVTLESSIESIKESIRKSNERKKLDSLNEVKKLKEEMKSKKTEYISLKTKVEQAKSKISELDVELENERRQYIIIQQDVRVVEKEIELYDSGKCPTCATPFDTDHFDNLRATLVNKKGKLVEGMELIKTNVAGVKERKAKIESISNEVNETYNDVTYFLRDCKTKIEKIEKQHKLAKEDVVDVGDFKNTIDEMTNKREGAGIEMAIAKEKSLCYKELNRIFSEDGVKKSIVKAIVKPINVFVRQNIRKMGLNFDVKLDDSFTASIKTLGSEIEPDSLSTGETRRINIAILIAYLKLIRTKKHINILFLDEIFSSIDFQGTQDILILLKSFANEYNINIFVVHHAIMNNEYFDRIIQIDKNIFTSINELTMAD